MMKNKKEQAAVAVRPATIETIIGENTEFEGNLTATSTLRIDGTFKGDINSQSTVIVGEDGKVYGNIKADSIFISGTVEGTILIANSTEFSATGYLKGEIDTRLLIVSEGAEFDGSCQMRESKSRKVRNISEADKGNEPGKSAVEKKA